ncbi:uncharacterized protein LOC132172759 [Corylus avellana]|uniref:uncharacterized protein LOC132172759 n=1 Tax=Corylus avellana TaxID=13451 RepID=UPI00286A71BB|nr:uncharacterized protein LOC132172759 [Corylus avellana]
MCPICDLVGETVGHVLWTCPAAVDVWAECMKLIQKCSSTEVSFVHVLEMLHGRLEEDGMQLVAVIARLLWLRKNKVIFGGDFQSPSTLHKLAHEQVDLFMKTEEGRWVQRPQQSNPVVQRWHTPPVGVVKINWDAAVDKDGEKMGIGIIARDHNGLILAAQVASRQYITDPTTAEALAAWKMA